jgi:hypothetical protein
VTWKRVHQGRTFASMGLGLFGDRKYHPTTSAIGSQ